MARYLRDTLTGAVTTVLADDDAAYMTLLAQRQANKPNRPAYEEVELTNPAVTPHAGSGGGGAGAATIRKFPFAHDTAGLLTGAAVYTPTVGDILLDGWIEIDTAWDGTTPLCDFAAFIGGDTIGLFGDITGPVDMSTVDISDGSQMPHGLLTGHGRSTGQSPSSLLIAMIAAIAPAGAVTRVLPAKFTSASPIKVVVSQDGTTIGADPGSTVGAAVLYLVTATPA